MDHQELMELQDFFDRIYVRKEACEETSDANRERMDRLNIEFTKSNTKLNILIGILAAISVPIMSVAVKMLFGS